MKFRLLLFFICCYLACADASLAQEKQAAPAPLTVGKTVEREISGGQTQSFLVMLQPGQFLRAVISSDDIDVAVTLIGPGAQKFLTVDLLKYPGPEPVSFEAATTGEYRVEIRADAASMLRGHYRLTSVVKPASDGDRQRLSAEHLLIEANDLEREGSKESLQKSLDKRGEALVIWRTLSDRYWEAYTLHYSGRAAATLNKVQEALAFYSQALSIRKEIGDRIGAAASLNNCGVIYAGLGEKEKALEYYNPALTIYKAIGDPIGEARTLGNLGSLFEGLGEKQKALDYYNQTLPPLRAVGDKRGEASRLINLGNLHYALGDKEKALGSYAEVPPVARDIVDQHGQADTLYNLAVAYFAMGDKQKALEFYSQALPLYRAIADKSSEADTISGQGSVFYAQGEKQKALESYSQALLLKRAVGDKSGEATTLSNLGIVYEALGEKQKALEYYNQTLQLRRALGDQSGEAATLINLGNIHSALGQKQQALEFYNQALALKRVVGDKSGEATALNNLGLVYYRLGQRPKALEFYNLALPLTRAAGDKSGEANTLINLGFVYSALGEKQKALEFYNQALPLKRAAGDKGGEATILNNFGLVYSDLGENQKALEFYSQALPLARAVSDKHTEAATLNYIGTVYNLLGEKQKALDFYNQALVIRRAVGDRLNEAASLHDLGDVYRELGERQKALDYYGQALPIFRAEGDQTDEALTLIGIGSVFYRLGERQRALALFNRALPIYRAIGDLKGEAMTLGNLANIYEDQGEPQKALESYQRALSIFREQGDRAHEAAALNAIGIVYHKLGDQQKAIDYSTQALPLNRAAGDRDGEAYALVNIGNSYDSLGDKQKALDNYEQALLLLRAVSDHDAEATTLDILMLASDRGGKAALAVFYGKQSVNLLQQLRANISGLNKSLQRTFLRSKESVYRSLANILIAHGRLSEAEEVLALLKDEEYSALRSRGDPKSAVAYSSAEAAAVKVLDQVGELGREQDQLRSQREKKVLDPAGQRRLDEIERELMPRANAEFRRMLAAIEKEAPETVIKMAEVKEAQSMMRYLRELGAGTVALYTVVSTEDGKSSKGWVILVTPNFQKAYEMEVADLDATVAAFRQTLRSPAYDPQPLAQKLYRMIFLTQQKQGQTLAADLEAYLRDQKEKTLMWSLDGVLRYVPMAVLHDGEQYLVERYRNVVFTTASLPGLTHAASRDWNALGLGVSKQYENFAALSGVTRELSAIVRDTSKHTGGVLPGAIKWDDEFKEKAMMDSLSEGYNVVHIATHFSYQAANPERSFLLLGDGAHLEMSKIEDLTTLFEKTDLVTLSACDTAVGSAMKDANGKDVEGFAYVVQKLGALAVIASLWPVDDVGTQVLMPKFYSLRQGGLSKAEALRQAQLSLLREGKQSDGTTTAQRSSETLGDAASTGRNVPFKAFKPDPNAKYSHPYYWAPFILIGNWK